MAIVKVELEETCKSCDGTGVIDEWNSKYVGGIVGEQCPKCLGIGVVITDLGREVIDFLKWRIKEECFI